jgi:hypothetical protein
MFTSTRSAGAAASVTVMFKLCLLRLFLLIGDAPGPWGCRTGLAREGAAPGAEG